MNQNIPKHILMIVARITELKKEKQNKIVLFLFNTITTFGKVYILKKGIIIALEIKVK